MLNLETSHPEYFFATESCEIKQQKEVPNANGSLFVGHRCREILLYCFSKRRKDFVVVVAASVLQRADTDTRKKQFRLLSGIRYVR